MKELNNEKLMQIDGGGSDKPLVLEVAITVTKAYWKVVKWVYSL